MISQGAKAVQSGQKLESFINDVILAEGYTSRSQVKFTDCYNNSRSKMDFYVPELSLAIECKRQMVSGTADQKLPFVLANLAMFPADNGLLVLDGDHYQSRAGIAIYLNSQLSETFDWCFAEDFAEWMKGVS
tara:strand:- start:316 stop:711 length:396 start_codon:yes stop_codon:yes gene_type:complete